MASNFLKKKASDQFKKGIAGGAANIEQKAKEIPTTKSGGGETKKTTSKASPFLNKKASDQSKKIKEEFGISPGIKTVAKQWAQSAIEKHYDEIQRNIEEKYGIGVPEFAKNYPLRPLEFTRKKDESSVDDSSGVTDAIGSFFSGLGYTGEKLLRGVVDGIEDTGDFLFSLPAAAIYGVSSGFGTWENPVSNWADGVYNQLNNDDFVNYWGSAEERWDKAPEWVKEAGWLPEGIGNLAPSVVAAYLSGGTSLAASGATGASTLGTTATGKLAPYVGDLVFGTQAAGSASETAIDKGANPWESTLFSSASGLSEVFTEKLFSGLAGTGIGKSFVKFKTSSPILNFALDRLGEGAEEMIMTGVDPILQRVTGVDSNAEWASWSDYVESGAHGAILSLVLGSTFSRVDEHNKKKAIRDLNDSAEILNGLTEDDAQKFEPLPDNATEEEITARQAEIRAVANSYNSFVAENAANEKSITSDTGAIDTLEKAAMDVVEKSRASMLINDVIELQSQNNEPISVSDIKKATGFGDSGAELVADYANAEGATFSQVEAEVRPSYLAGFNNPDMDISKVEHTFDTPAQAEAYKAGQLDSRAQALEADVKAENARVYGEESGVVKNEHSTQYTPNELKMADTMGKDLGSQVSFEERLIADYETEVEANAEHQDGKITISNNSDNKLFKDTIHEGFHRMKEMNTPEVQTLERELFDFADSEGILFENERAKYEQAGMSLDTGGNIEEVVADIIPKLWKNEKDWLKWRERLDSNPELRSGWQKLMDIISEIIEKFRRLLKEGSFSKEARAKVNKDLAELERFRNLYGDAYKATMDAVQEKTKEAKAETASEPVANESTSVDTESINETKTSENTSEELTTRPAMLEGKAVNFADILPPKAEAGTKFKNFSLKEIVDENNKSYGIGVVLDSTLLDNLTPEERVEMVKEYVKELGGNTFTAYDSNGVAVDIKIAESKKHFKNKSGKNVAVNKDLTSYLGKNETKQEAITLVDELIVSAKYSHSEVAKHSHGWLDNKGKNNWDYWTTYIQDKNKTIWEAKLNIANSTNGEKILYDIFPIKKVGQSVTSDKSTTDGSLSQNQKSVKKNFSLKDGVQKNTYTKNEKNFGLKKQNKEYDYSKSFAEQIDDFVKGNFPKNDTLIVGKTEKVYRDIGFNALPITIRQGHIRAALDKNSGADHYLGEPGLKQIPNALKNPVAIIRSQSHTSRVVALLPIKTNGKTTIAPFEIDGIGVANNDNIDSNELVTVFGKGNIIKQLSDALNKEASGDIELFYWNKKEALSLLQSKGLQLPSSLPQDGFVHSIREKGANINTKFKNVTQTQQFKRWFGKSKVVNADGTPRVVYHGTADEFYVFDKSKNGSNTGAQSAKKAFFFTDSKKVADGYANDARPESINQLYRRAEQLDNQAAWNGKYELAEQAWQEYEDAELEFDGTNYTMGVYLSIKNPLMYDFKGSEYRETTYNDLIKQAIKEKRDGVIFLNTFDSSNNSYDEMCNVYAVFEPTQIKSATDNIGTFDGSNPDIRYSIKGGVSTSELYDTINDAKNGKKKAIEKLSKYAEDGIIRTEAYDALIEKYGAIKTGERPHRDVTVPAKTAKDKKVSKTVRTVLEAKATPDTLVPTIEKMVEDGVFSYDVYTDKEAINNAENYIKEYGWEESLLDWFDAVNKGEVSKDLTTTGWALYNNAANKAATATTEEARKEATKTSIRILDAMIQHQRSAAQALQATRILKKMSPETQLYAVQKSVSALQNELKEKYGKKAPDLKINEELVEQFLTAETDDARLDAEIKIYKDIGKQMPSTFMDKWNAWRYLAMLGNLRTHIRNVVGNAGFAPIVATKNLVATGIESLVNPSIRGINYIVSHVAPSVRWSGKEMLRSKKIVFGSKADRALLKAAWNDYSNVADAVSNGGKYNDSAMANKHIDEGRKIFKSKLFAPVEWARKKNSKALETEDMWFAKPHYAYALAQYCKANNITPEQIQRGKAIAPAREYAIKEAQKATYKDTNAFSQFVSSLGRTHTKKNVITKGASAVVEGILPFRKTPANILVRGVEYSPLGLVKGLTRDLYKVSKGELNAYEAIDNISAGLTGTGLLALGVYLAAEGLIRGHGEDEEKEKAFKEMMGHQAYSLELPNGQSITLDWLAPEALPFFVGVNIWETTKGKNEKVNMASILQAVTGISEPLLEMSCLQGVNDLIEGVGYASSNGMSGLMAVLSSATTSYLTQGIPTLSGQAERTSEDERMTTYTEKNVFLTGDMQYLLGKASAKIPGWDYNQIPYIDAWGRKEASGTALKRGLNNFLNPAYTSTIETSDMEKELLRVYEQTGEASVFPTRADKYFMIDGVRKDLTADEYVRYATLKGEMSYQMVAELVTSKGYKKMTDKEKVKAIEDVYDYANQKAKEAISNYKPQKWVSTADEFGSNAENYIAFRTEVSEYNEKHDEEISKEKYVDFIFDYAESDSEAWLMYLNKYDSKTAIEAEKYGIDAELYMTAVVDMDAIKADYGANGKAINGSRKAKIVRYLNSVCNSYKEYLFLLGTEYESVKDDADYIQYFGN